MGDLVATPRNYLTGLLADAVGGVNNFASKPFGYNNPPGAMLSGLLGLPAIANTLNEASYGGSLTTGKGMTTRPKSDTADAALGLLGLTPVANAGVNAAVRGAQRLEPAINRAVTATMDRGGFPAMALDAMASGAQSNIVSPAKAKSLATVKQLPSDQLFSDAVANTNGAQITEDGLLMSLQRGQNPNQSNMPSVRGGVFYLPEGAAQSKFYTTGKNGYGGTEKVSGETLLQNPLFVKGATGGKAPEAAIDQLLGKGTYEAIRTDALKTLGYGLPKAEKVSRVREFLAKYAPELQDKAEYIVSNSAQGNQLPYALQEAAVGAAVRNAGHDAVLGYSKGKNGPFLSEVFDVRESHYPDKFGTSTVWPELESSSQPVKQPFVYPQQAALDAAQRNAALPVEQGGLGLRPDNTPMERAAAMGFDTDLLHGTTNDFPAFSESTRHSTYATQDPAIADIYANATGRQKALREINAGPNVIPLMGRGKLLETSDYRNGSGGWMQNNMADALGIEPKRGLTKELPAHGYDGAKVTMDDLGGSQTQFIYPDPKVLRSRFAAFDPMRRNENDLLAGALPFTALIDQDNRNYLRGLLNP